MSYMTFAEPTGLFSGLELVLEVCVVCVPVLSSLSFLGERHSLAQWPGLPQLWHLPLRRRCFLLSVTDKASSVAVSFLLPPCLDHRLFTRSASLQTWLVRATMLNFLAPLVYRAEESRFDAN